MRWKTLLKKCPAVIFCSFLAVYSFAGNSGFLVSGGQLVPTVKTDIELKSEVLSITLTDRGYTDIDVYYEFFNPGTSIMFKVYFEAKGGDGYKVKSTEDSHPFISDFNVIVNGARQTCRTKLIQENGFREIASVEECRDIPFSFGYFFTACFKPGDNTVHHTYRIKNSGSEFNTFHIPYMLTPAMKWGNKCIGEFTLLINSVTTAKHFCIDNAPFRTLDFHIAGGDGKTRQTCFSGRKVTEVCIRNASAIWKAENFKPASEMDIYSADWMVTDNFSRILTEGLFYDRAIPGYQPTDNLSKTEIKILRSLPFASRGMVFSDSELNKFFNGIWWYMPDPDWKKSTKGFTPEEKKMLSKTESAGIPHPNNR